MQAIKINPEAKKKHLLDSTNSLTRNSSFSCTGC